jgi:hypothetical protein
VLRQVAEGVLIHESEFCQSNAVAVHGQAGVLLIDPGIYGSEMACVTAQPAARLPSEICGQVRTGRTASPGGYPRTSPSRCRGTSLASSPVCPPRWPAFRGMARKSGLSSIRRMHERQLQQLAQRSERDGTPG